MRALCLGLVVVLLSSAAVVRAEEQVQGVVVITPELIEAQYALQLAQAKVRDYQFVELPAMRRELDNQVELAETEIAILSGRLRDYRPFLRVGEYSPVRTAAESHYLALRAAEQRLEQLKDARIALVRNTRQQFTLYNLEVLHAATRVAMLKQELTTPVQ